MAYKKPKHTDQYLHCSSHNLKSCKESVVSSVFNRAHSSITNNNNLTKENVTIKEMLKGNICQESIISKIVHRITSNNNLSQSRRETQATSIPSQ